MSEEFFVRMCSDVAFPTAVAFYVLTRINPSLERIANTVDKLEKRIERLEDKILLHKPRLSYNQLERS